MENKEMNVENLKKILWEESQKVINGETSPAKLSSVNGAMKTILMAEALRIKVSKVNGDKLEAGFLSIEK